MKIRRKLKGLSTNFAFKLECNNRNTNVLNENDEHILTECSSQSVTGLGERSIDVRFNVDADEAKQLRTCITKRVKKSLKFRKYWKQRFDLFSRFNDGILLDMESWFSVTPERIAEHVAERCRCDVIVDGFCGSGGNAIQFARTCHRVIAIDIDPVKIRCAIHNARIYGVEDRIEFICGDYFKVIRDARFVPDVVFLAPPWGGPQYLAADVFNIDTMMSPSCFAVYEAARALTDYVVLFMPRNSSVLQLVLLAGLNETIEIEQNYLNSKLKAVTVYYGNVGHVEDFSVIEHSCLNELPSLLTRFDEGDVLQHAPRELVTNTCDPDNVSVVPQSRLELVTAALIETFCTLAETDPQKQRFMLNVLGARFANLVSPVYFSEVFYPLREHLKLWLSKEILLSRDLVDSACSVRPSLLPSRKKTVDFFQQILQQTTIERSLTPANNEAFERTFHPWFSRYHADFMELSCLGSGGFGKVYKVMHKLDKCSYAIKKVYFDVADSSLCAKVLREVRHLAQLSHKNVIRYFASWLEFEVLPVKDVVAASKRRYKRCSSSNDVQDCGQDYCSDEVLNVANACIVREDESNTNGRDLSLSLRRNYSSPEISFHVENIHDNSNRSDFKDESLSKAGSQYSATVASSTCDKISNGSFGASVRSRNLSTSAFNSQKMNRSSDEAVVTVQPNLFPPLVSMTRIALYIQMELCGSTLRDWLNRRNSILSTSTNMDPFSLVNENSVLSIIRQLVRALNYIHSKGIIHRDLKPSNVFVDAACQVLLGDFGLACHVHNGELLEKADHTQENDRDSLALLNSEVNHVEEPSNVALVKASQHSCGIGTKAYSAPEQLKIREYDSKVDIFSLGVIAFELYHPFKTNMERVQCLYHLRESRISENFRLRWPKEVEIIKQLVNFKPASRPSAATLLSSPFFQPQDTAVLELRELLKQKEAEVDHLKSTVAMLEQQLRLS